MMCGIRQRFPTSPAYESNSIALRAFPLQKSAEPRLSFIGQVFGPALDSAYLPMFDLSWHNTMFTLYGHWRYILDSSWTIDGRWSHCLFWVSCFFFCLLTYRRRNSLYGSSRMLLWAGVLSRICRRLIRLWHWIPVHSAIMLTSTNRKAARIDNRNELIDRSWSWVCRGRLFLSSFCELVSVI